VKKTFLAAVILFAPVVAAAQTSPFLPDARYRARL
jgi:hypothetical protein